jgi:hypothetical protein
MGFMTIAQKNAFGLSAGFYHFNAPTWNEFLDKYNSGDTVTSPQPGFTHIPIATFLYERKVKDYLYVQLHFSYGYMQSVSKQNGDLRLKVQAPGAGVYASWYPMKMIKGTRKTAANPIVLQVSFSGIYQMKELTLNGKNVWNPEQLNVHADNVGLFIGTGIGYDLHFGKRIVIQTVFDAAFCPTIEMAEFEYFIELYDKYGYSIDSRAFLLGAHVSMLFLF